jgi:hypothetical protein
MPEVDAGTVIAGYRIERVIGRGGMGLVYLATQLDLGRHVALKVIAPDYADDELFRERFKQESRLAASIDHPNVIPVYEAREANGALFLSMRYVDGPDLRRLVKRDGPLDPERAAGIVSQVASALDAAHRRGLVHRDVKPGNVLIVTGDPEHAYLTDFGLVKHTAASGDLTQSGQFVGTLDYTAPEQIQAQRPDGRTDVYSLGCVLFHTLTGRPPFERETQAAKIYAHLNDPPPRPSELVHDVPEELDDVVARAMAKDRAERFPSAGDLGRATRAAVEQRAPSQPEGSVATGPAAPATPGSTRVAKPEPTTARLPHRARRRRWIALAMALAVGATAALVFAFVIAPDGSDTGQLTSLDSHQSALLLTIQDGAMERLARSLDDGQVDDLPVRPAVDFAGADLGSGGMDEVLAVYSRCDKEGLCNVYRSVLGRGAESVVPGADLPKCSEAGPSVANGAIAFGLYRVGDPTCRRGLYLKRRGSDEPKLFASRWDGGTELNEDRLAWVVGNSIRLSPVERYQPVTVKHPDGHKFAYPVALEGGRLYFIDREDAHGTTPPRYYIARTDAQSPSAIERYGSGRAIVFKGKPAFAVGFGGDSLYFSGETDDDPKSGMETVTRDDDPQFTPWLTR